MERLVKRRKQIGYSVIEYHYEIIDGERQDTKVIMNDQLLCVIAGNTIQEFDEKITNLINTYRI